LSIRYVFQSGIKFSKKQELGLIYLVSSIAIVINQISLFTLVDLLYIEMMISKMVATIVTFFWNYLTRKNIIFKEAGEKEPIPIFKKIKNKKSVANYKTKHKCYTARYWLWS